MAWVYILECSDGSFYVGSTVNLENRIAQHNRGEGARYTARRRPVELAWAAELDRIDEAFTLEKQIQNWSRAKRQALIEGRFADLPGLAEKHGISWRMRQRERGSDGPAPAVGLDA
ncbi:MAG TPA: GIY-YIG nuclease family protein [Nocardioidaceae bacterium]|nr:GIY-YIG nuclease family protein [Nocardioidaceae bacterium]